MFIDCISQVNMLVRHLEIQFLACPDRFRNLQTDLFCIKRDFIGPKKMYILVTFVIKFVKTITVVVFIFMIGPNIHTF